MNALKKLFSALLVLVLVFAPLGLAAEGDSNFTNVVASGDVTSGDDVIVGDDVTAEGDVTFRSSLLAKGRAGGASTVKSSSTNLTADTMAHSIIIKHIGADGSVDETGVGTVLPNGTPGQVLTLVAGEVQSGGSWIVTPATTTGFTSLTFDASGERTTLLYLDDTYGWIVESNFGTT